MDATPLVHTRMARNMPHKNTKNIIPASTPAPFIPKIIPKRPNANSSILHYCSKRHRARCPKKTAIVRCLSISSSAYPPHRTARRIAAGATKVLVR